MTTHNGAIVLVALLPILPLAIYLRRRRKVSRRGMQSAAAVSLVLLICGIGAAVGSGV